ncbi:MAG TPA: TonB-dependent receptor plug domain-containing protein [Opitutaceae bacterium]|nr:TonB-dependent receptor plug domain-containing protein [Opitutaceae bacterium]
MNQTKLPRTLSRALLTQVCVGCFAASFALAQQAPAPDAATLAKYDANKNGVLDPNEVAAMNAAQGKGAGAPVEKIAPASKDEIVTLSPFEVVSDTKGYYAANTMSGTRFNTKLDDLASSITVVTKQQMQDFAMLDINDIFLYTAGTEGTGTYTDYTLDRNGSIADNVQLNPANANRVRGIAPANVSLGNIETMNRVPIDPITIDSVEISRGPNANVFGLGNPSGTVNEVPAAANVTRDRTVAEFRGDSYGGWRTSLDVNRVLVPNQLAIRASAVFQHEGFERKPSGVDTERYNGMVKFQPFKNTTISGAVYYYHSYGNRPNAIPPRDNLSYWIASGKPTWDPVTQQIHINGATVATVTAATYNGPDYFSATYLGNDRNQMFIDQNGLSYWAAARGTTSTVSPAAATLQAARYLQPTAAAGAVFSGTAPRPFAQPLFNTTPTISDRSIYDWTSINLSAPNRFWDRTLTTNVQLDQIFLATPTQTLAAQFGFMREDSQRWARNLLGIANDNGQSGQLTVDINERRLDGSANPFFLRPYVGTDKPRTVSQPAKWDTLRAQAAYRLDLTRNEGLLHYLGWFQATGYDEYKYRINRQYSYRDAIVSDASWIPAGTYRGTNSVPAGTPPLIALTQGLYRYYVGDTNGNNVDYAPGNFKYGTYPFVWGNAATGVFTTNNLTLGPAAADKSGGTASSNAPNTKVVLKTLGGVIQNHLLGDRLVTTLGIRHDAVYTKFGNAGAPVTNAYLLPDGITFDSSIIDTWAAGDYYHTGGQTTNVQFVARPFADTPVLASVAQQGAGGKFLSDVLGGLSVNYNQSRSFLPTVPAQDLFKNPLPNPTGSDRSWGFGLNLLDGKLVVRVSHYDDYQRDAQTNDMNTMAGRVLRVDLQTTGAGSPTPQLNLHDNAFHWVQFTNPTWTTDQITAEVARITKFSAADATYYTNASPPIGATADVHSVGTELEVNVNPNRYWTITGSVTDAKAANQHVSSALVDWIAQRLPVWTTLVDPTITDANAATEGNPQKLWWLHRYSTAPVLGTVASFSATSQTPAENYQAFVGAPFGIIKAQEGKSNPQVRRYNFRASTSYQLAGITENQWLKRVSVGGAFRWEDKAAIGYYGVQSLPAIINDLDPNRPIYDKSHYYVDAFVSYRMKLWGDRIGATFKLNARNIGENGRLQPVGAFPDGTIHTYRIVDPQQFILTASFDL